MLFRSKKFTKNANAKGFDKDRKQLSTSHFKSQDKRKKDAKDGGQYTVPVGPKCFGCPTEGIVEDVDEEEELVESKFEKMDEQNDIHTAYAKLYKVSEKHEKMYRLASKKFSDVELVREELSTKVDEANQTIGVLRFENNLLAVSHLTEQWHDSIWKPESASILSCSFLRSSQSSHVPFKLERFQFFPLTASSRVYSKERFFQGVEGKGLQVIMSLFLSPLLAFFVYIT